MMLQLGDDGVVSSVNEEDLIYVDKNELDQFVESYHKLEKENEQLKQQLLERERMLDVRDKIIKDVIKAVNGDVE